MYILRRNGDQLKTYDFIFDVATRIRYHTQFCRSSLYRQQCTLVRQPRTHWAIHKLCTRVRYSRRFGVHQTAISRDQTKQALSRWFSNTKLTPWKLASQPSCTCCRPLARQKIVVFAQTRTIKNNGFDEQHKAWDGSKESLHGVTWRIKRVCNVRNSLLKWLPELCLGND